MPFRIATPDASLDELSFAATDADALTEWVGSLPMADATKTATQLKRATEELALLRIGYRERLALLEAIRPTLEYICTRLDATALKSNDQEASVGQLAQRLQANLAVGYKSVVVGAQPEAEADRTVLKDVLPLALHRSISELSKILLRSLQLYVTPSEHLWLEMNQLYAIAEHYEIADASVVDEVNQTQHKTTVRAAYLRPVMLAASKPNQLRHRDLSYVFNALELWAPWAEIKDTDTDAFLTLDLEADSGPRYKGVVEDAIEPRVLRTEVLAFEIEAFLKEIDSKLPIPDYMSCELLNHLVEAWGKMRKRVHYRVSGSGALRVCIGLNAVHYFLSGAVPFRDQLSTTDAMLKKEVNPFVISEDQYRVFAAPDDPWDAGYLIPENPNIENPNGMFNDDRANEDGRPAYQFFNTEVTDTSPGGYRIQWARNFPRNLQAGELIGIRENDDARWCIAVVRWIQPTDTGAATGIELIAPRAIPVAARVIRKKGGPTDYSRALLLPELSAIDQPAMLVTPRLPYQAGQKIHVQRQGIQATAQLADEVTKTESFNQFTFRMLDGYLENAQIDLNMENLSEMIGFDAPEPSR